VLSLDVQTVRGQQRKVALTVGTTTQDPPFSRIIPVAGVNVGYLYLNGFSTAQIQGIEKFSRILKRPVLTNWCLISAIMMVEALDMQVDWRICWRDNNSTANCSPGQFIPPVMLIVTATFCFIGCQSHCIFTVWWY